MSTDARFDPAQFLRPAQFRTDSFPADGFSAAETVVTRKRTAGVVKSLKMVNPHLELVVEFTEANGSKSLGGPVE